jgi:hypothetical protein
MLHDSQEKAREKLHKFFESPYGIFYLIGYAGSGKTFLIVYIIGELLKKLKSTNIIVAAPTHKALSKLRSDFIEAGYEAYFHVGENTIVYETNQVSFMTNSSLLGYKAQIDNKGDRVFRKQKALPDHLKDPQLKYVFADECSMIDKDQAEHLLLLTDMLKELKIVLMGDPAQLNPVNEIESMIFQSIPEDYEYLFPMTKIVRTKKKQIAKVCKAIRNWDGKNLYQLLQTNLGEGVHLIESKNLVAEFLKKEEAIVLPWRNNTCDTHNREIRMALHKKTVLADYMKGDVLIFGDFYKASNCVNFYTSSQVEVTDVLESDEYTAQWKKDYSGKYVETVHQYIDQLKLTPPKYQVQKMAVKSLGATPKEAIIMVLDKSCKERWEAETQMMKTKLYQFVSIFHEKKMIEHIWKQFYDLYIDPFAPVSYGFSITTHKSQCSTYAVVFVNVEDILTNRKIAEMQKCLYTAASRASEELYFVI